MTADKDANKIDAGMHLLMSYLKILSCWFWNNLDHTNIAKYFF